MACRQADRWGCATGVLLLSFLACQGTTTPVGAGPAPALSDDGGTAEAFSADPRRTGSAYVRQLAALPVGFVGWRADAWTQARASQRPLLVRVGSADCGACAEEDARTWSVPSVVARVRQGWAPLALDTREDAGALLRLGLPATDGLWWLDPSGQVRADLGPPLQSGVEALSAALGSTTWETGSPEEGAPWVSALATARARPPAALQPQEVTLLLHAAREIHRNDDGERALSVLRLRCQEASADHGGGLPGPRGGTEKTAAHQAAWLLALLDGLAWQPDAALRRCAQGMVAFVKERLVLAVNCPPPGNGHCLLFSDGTMPTTKAQRQARTPATVLASSSAVATGALVVALLDASAVLGDVSTRLLALGVLDTWVGRGLSSGAAHSLDLRALPGGRQTLADQAELILALVHAHEHTGDPAHLQRARNLTAWTVQHFCAAGPCEAATALPWEPVPSKAVAGVAQARFSLAMVRLSAVEGDASRAAWAQQHIQELWPRTAAWARTELALAAWEAAAAPRFLWVMHQSSGKGTNALTDRAFERRMLGLAVRHGAAPPGLTAATAPRAAVCLPQCSPPVSDPAQVTAALKAAQAPGG